MFSLKCRRFVGIVVFLCACSPALGQENVWVKLNDFIGGKRERAVAFSINGYGYVGTGTDTAEVVRADFWRYDPNSDSWAQIAPIPGPARRDAVAFELNGFGYVGTGMSDHVSANGNILSDFWRYNAILNEWDSIAPFPGNQGGGVYFSTGFSVGGKGYVCGGKTGNSTYTSELWEYKPTNDTWFQRASFPTGIRYMLSSFAIGNFAYVGFGATQDVYKRDLYRYNPGNNQWDQMPDLPGNVRGAATTFVLQDKGYVCGGNDGGLLDDLWEFNPISEEWTLKAYFGGSERKNAIAFSINHEFAIVGLGKGYTGKKESVYVYYPSSYLGLSNNIGQEIQIFPNPGRTNIQLRNLPDDFDRIECISFLGLTVFSTNNVPASNAFESLPSGLYYLKVYRENQHLIAVKPLLIN